MSKRFGRALSRAGATTAVVTAVAATAMATMTGGGHGAGEVARSHGAETASRVAPISKHHTPPPTPPAKPKVTYPKPALAPKPEAPYPQARTVPAPLVRRAADPTVVATISVGSSRQYRLVGSAGGVYAFGAPAVGSLLGQHINAPIVAAASLPNDRGYVLSASDGGVFPFGGAGFYGSLSGRRLQAPITGVATDPATGGYWLVGSDGGVFALHAPFYGSANKLRLASPIVAITATPSGHGYWLVSSDGGVFAFGDARYAGSASKWHLGAPIDGIAATPSGHGYWLVSSDGGVFAFGDARYAGSASKWHLGAPIDGIAATPSGHGYWLVSSDGGVFAFGDAHYLGSLYLASSRPAPIATPPTRSRTVHTAALRVAALPGPTGFDISQYQCRDIPAEQPRVAIVQVTGGSLTLPPNACYAREARWAGANLSSYIFLDGLSHPSPLLSRRGPAGNCAITNLACESYNFGYVWAQRWVAYSRSVHVDSKMWWLDVEAGSGWNSTVSNDLVIEGAVAGVRSMHVAVGIYSTAYQWHQIAGSLSFPGMAIWTPGAGNLRGAGYTAAGYCTSGSQSFAGGHLSLVQWGYRGNFAGAYSGPPSGYDMDLACHH